MATTQVVETATIRAVSHLNNQVEKRMDKVKSLLDRSAIPLDRAVLCLDCNCVSDANRQCPACSSSALMNLSVVLNRDAHVEFAYERELVAA